MAEIKFIQDEWHTVWIKKEMITTTTDWEGNEVISEEDLLTYIAEGTTGDDEKDEICMNQIYDAEPVKEETDWWSERKGCTEVEYKLIEDDDES